MLCHWPTRTNNELYCFLCKTQSLCGNQSLLALSLSLFLVSFLGSSSVWNAVYSFYKCACQSIPLAGYWLWTFAKTINFVYCFPNPDMPNSRETHQFSLKHRFPPKLAQKPRKACVRTNQSCIWQKSERSLEMLRKEKQQRKQESCFSLQTENPVETDGSSIISSLTYWRFIIPLSTC